MMQQQFDEVGRLVEVGYMDMLGLALEAFANSLGNPQLQKHLLTVLGCSSEGMQ